MPHRTSIWTLLLMSRGDCSSGRCSSITPPGEWLPWSIAPVHQACNSCPSLSIVLPRVMYARTYYSQRASIFEQTALRNFCARYRAEAGWQISEFPQDRRPTVLCEAESEAHHVGQLREDYLIRRPT